MLLIECIFLEYFSHGEFSIFGGGETDDPIKIYQLQGGMSPLTDMDFYWPIPFPPLQQSWEPPQSQLNLKDSHGSVI